MCLFPFFKPRWTNVSHTYFFLLWLALRFRFCPALNMISLWIYLCVICFIMLFSIVDAQTFFSLRVLNYEPTKMVIFKQLVSLQRFPHFSYPSFALWYMRNIAHKNGKQLWNFIEFMIIHCLNVFYFWSEFSGVFMKLTFSDLQRFLNENLKIFKLIKSQRS